MNAKTLNYHLSVVGSLYSSSGDYQIAFKDGVLIGANGETEIRTTLPEDLGSFTLDARVISYLRSLEGDLTFHLNSGKLFVSHSKGETNFVTGDFLFFPQILEPDQPTDRTAVHSEILREALLKTDFVSADETKPTQGILLEVKDDKLTLIGTDHAVLSIFSLPAKGNMRVIIPIRAAKLLAKFLPMGNVTIFCTNSTARFSCESFSLTTRLVAGDYPKVQKMDDDVTFFVQIEELFTSLKRLSSLPAEHSAIKFNFNRNILTLSINTDLGPVTERVPLAGEHSAELYFDPQRVMRALLKLNGEQVKVKTGKRLIFEQSENEQIVVLPVRVLSYE